MSHVHTPPAGPPERGHLRTDLVRLGAFAQLLLAAPPFPDARPLPPSTPVSAARDLVRYSCLLAQRLRPGELCRTSVPLLNHIGFLFGLTALVASPSTDPAAATERLAGELLATLDTPEANPLPLCPPSLFEQLARELLGQVSTDRPSPRRALPSAALELAADLYSLGDSLALSVILCPPPWRTWSNKPLSASRCSAIPPASRSLSSSPGAPEPRRSLPPPSSQTSTFSSSS